MGVIEGYANIVTDSQLSEPEKDYRVKIFAMMIVGKLLLVLLVAKVLWPKVMPQLSTSIKSNPSFMSLIGLVVIFNILF
jgi:hypothetical protein